MKRLVTILCAIVLQLTALVALGVPAQANTPAICASDFATGGTITVVTISGVPYCVHRFTTVGTATFTPRLNLTIDYLIVGGGGGGAGATRYVSAGGGGGGAGGLVFRTGRVVAPNTPIGVTVGNGGNGIDTPDVAASNGGNSVFDGLVALGGGGGILTGGNNNNPARNGGSGGGGRQNPAGIGLQPTSAAGGFGNNGARNSADQGGGGGGGAGAAAVNITGANGGNGGNGRDYSLFFGTGVGANGVFAGGGGGGGNAVGARGLGGTGGGGNGASDRDNLFPAAGQANTGGGGGGGGSDHAGAVGGSGVVIVRYVASRAPVANAGNDATVVTNATFVLDGTGSTDPDNDIIGYSWTQLSGPSVTLTNAMTAQASFTAPQPIANPTSVSVFQLTVTDSLGNSSTDTVTITVQGIAILNTTKNVAVFSQDGGQCTNFTLTPPSAAPLPAAIPNACVEYRITVTNTGVGLAQNISVVDAVPGDLAFQAAMLTGAWGGGSQLITPPILCGGPGCTVRVQNGSLGAGQHASIVVRLLIR
jgi:uncharacterized repeat protein (TIGR01451 family)